MCLGHRLISPRPERASVFDRAQHGAHSPPTARLSPSQSQGARDGARWAPRVVGLIGLPRVVGRVGLGGGDEERWPGMFSKHRLGLGNSASTSSFPRSMWYPFCSMRALEYLYGGASGLLMIFAIRPCGVTSSLSHRSTSSRGTTPPSAASLLPSFQGSF